MYLFALQYLVRVFFLSYISFNSDFLVVAIAELYFFPPSDSKVIIWRFIFQLNKFHTDSITLQ